ncbi:MAG: polyprenyl diphosphate synthase [Mariprofundaceae bacterium]|nr:polyprenyl diphosphate synthase [Mariprofundaceae bacterium]
MQEVSKSIPQHVAIIMDGNGRWAKMQGKERLQGHRQGAGHVRDVVEWASDAGVKQVSLYVFSTENWRRPKFEVKALMALLTTLLPLEISAMNKKGVRLLTLGDLSKLPWLARKSIQKTCNATQHNQKIDLILCLNYGGQQEIVGAVQSFCQSWQEQGCSVEQLAELTVEKFSSYLPRKNILPVDLLIRTGDECRISNFYLWDVAYAELYFTDCLWPDYSREELQRALDDYASRERRFGRTSEQVQALERK